MEETMQKADEIRMQQAMNTSTDESQDKYYTYDDCRHATFGIPLTSPTENIEKTGLLLEALSADSYHNLIPKYLDSVVTFKLPGASIVNLVPP